MEKAAGELLGGIALGVGIGAYFVHKYHRYLSECLEDYQFSFDQAEQNKDLNLSTTKERYEEIANLKFPNFMLFIDPILFPPLKKEYLELIELSKKRLEELASA